MCRYVTSFDENGTPLFSFFRGKTSQTNGKFQMGGFIHECISPRGNIIYSDFTVHHKKREAQATEISESFRKKFRGALSLTRATPLLRQGAVLPTKMYAEGAAVLERALDMDLKNNRNEACLFLYDCYNAMDEKAESVSFAVQESGKGTSPARTFCVGLQAFFQSAARLRDCGILVRRGDEMRRYVRKRRVRQGGIQDVYTVCRVVVLLFLSGGQKKALMFHEKAKVCVPLIRPSCSTKGFSALNKKI